MRATLYRWNSTPIVTLGVMHVDDFRCHTIERPWIPDEEWTGGLKRESCVPDGVYALEPYTRTNGDEVYMLVNPLLGVWGYEDDIPDDRMGRSKILLHLANFRKDIICCIGPGFTQTEHPEHGQMVGNSRAAMFEITERLNQEVDNTMEIKTL